MKENIRKYLPSNYAKTVAEKCNCSKEKVYRVVYGRCKKAPEIENELLEMAEKNKEKIEKNLLKKVKFE